MRGRLIVIEGIDGAGKGTVCDLLMENENLIDPVVVKNIVDESSTGGAIRNIMRVGDSEYINHPRIALLYLSELIYVIFREGGVEDILSSGRDVIMDRYYFSTLAYAPSELTGKVIEESLKNGTMLKPDLTICLDVCPSVAIRRIERRNIKKEYYECMAKLTDIRKRYLGLTLDGYDVEYLDSTIHIQQSTLNNILNKLKRK